MFPRVRHDDDVTLAIHRYSRQSAFLRFPSLTVHVLQSMLQSSALSPENNSSSILWIRFCHNMATYNYLDSWSNSATLINVLIKLSLLHKKIKKIFEIRIDSSSENCTSRLKVSKRLILMFKSIYIWNRHYWNDNALIVSVKCIVKMPEFKEISWVSSHERFARTYETGLNRNDNGNDSIRSVAERSKTRRGDIKKFLI